LIAGKENLATLFPGSLFFPPLEEKRDLGNEAGKNYDLTLRKKYINDYLFNVQKQTDGEWIINGFQKRLMLIYRQCLNGLLAFSPK